MWSCMVQALILSASALVVHPAFVQQGKDVLLSAGQPGGAEKGVKSSRLIYLTWPPTLPRLRSIL